MTTNPALDWLHAEFEHAIAQQSWKSPDRFFDPNWHGPAAIRPMIQLRPLLAGGAPMKVTSADYADPERRWL
jgi:hypothetical protein